MADNLPQSAARIGDLHACADIGPNVGANLEIENGSPNILINRKAAARVGDKVSCRMAITSDPVIQEGCSRYFLMVNPLREWVIKLPTAAASVRDRVMCLLATAYK